MQWRDFSTILERDGDLFVALCPELDIASQGATAEEATANLREAVELFLKCSDPSEVEARMTGTVATTTPEAVEYEKALLNRLSDEGLIRLASFTGIPPRIPAIPFEKLLEDLKRDRSDR